MRKPWIVLLVDVWLEPNACPPEEVILDLDTTDVALHGPRRTVSSMAITTTTAICHSIFFRGAFVVPHAAAAVQYRCLGREPGRGETDRRADARRAWPEVRIILRADSASAQRPPDELV